MIKNSFKYLFLLVLMCCSFIGCTSKNYSRQIVYGFNYKYDYDKNNSIKLLSVSYSFNIVELILELNTPQYDFEDYEFSLYLDNEKIYYNQELIFLKNNKTLQGKGNFEQIIIVFSSENFETYRESDFLLESLIYINPVKNISFSPLKYFRITQSDIISNN